MKMRHMVWVVLIGVAGCASPPAPTVGPAASVPAPPSEAPIFSQTGIASLYGADHQGMTTANGERFDPQALTAAHRSLPFGTIARVTSLADGRSVKIRINDRGPHIRNRIVDLSAAAAAVLGMSGTMRVRVEVFPSDQGS